MGQSTLDKTVTWLDVTTVNEAESLLRVSGLLHADQRVLRLEPAGDGNMNVTLRAELAAQNLKPVDTLILKQSRPYVAKYDTIPAPLDRISFEAAFYQFANDKPFIKQRMPRLMAWRPESKLLVLQDLGRSTDGTSLYRDFPQSELPSDLSLLVDWLKQLHTCSRGQIDSQTFGNHELRVLNHEHIFVVPFRDPPLTDLDAACPGLEQRSRSLRMSTRLGKHAQELGRQYLRSGDTLLHGDFYPGSWLLTSAGPYVIDPEFCYAGEAEFDWGILLGHLKMIGVDEAERALKRLIGPSCIELDWNLIREYAAVEILRRILGVAQLPISMNLEQRLQLAEQAADALLP